MDPQEMVPGGAVIGIGTDIIEVPRIADMIRRHNRYFLERVFTPDEIAYCQQYRVAEQHYAARWAAKEAALKALGTGWAKGIRWTDIEVVRQPGGAPQLQLHHRALASAHTQGIQEMKVSLSHCKAYAMACVIAIGHPKS